MYLKSFLFIWTTCLVLIIPTFANNAPKNNTAIVPHPDRGNSQLDFAVTPPYPLLELGMKYVLGQTGANASAAENAAIADVAKKAPAVNLPATIPRVNAVCGEAFPCDVKLDQLSAPLSLDISPAPVSPLAKRTTQCGPGQPCVDGSCCNSLGNCGYSPVNCNAAVSSYCISNCNAKAMCGRYSLNGAQKCPLNLCCSYFGYCGTTSAFCTTSGSTPCQQGYGSCAVASVSACDPNGKSATNGRKVAYYASGNVNWRTCNRIAPNQINSTGLSHLIYTFVSVDPSTFAISVNVGDLATIKQFTGLKTTAMQTWVAVGGFGFSDPGPTQTTWSTLSANPTNRAAFITSLKNFMIKWGFQGVDLDWEFPTVPSRGGNAADLINLVSLVREMRASFGTSYGISAALPPDFAYLSGFDPIALQPYVNFFNFMAYDMHGTWEASYLGAYVRSQTNIVDVGNNLLPLWFDGVNPAKINLGIADYGRGYTLSNTSCTAIGCPYSGPNTAGRCTDSAGLLSLREIERTISQNSLTPTLLNDQMIKQIVYSGNQWVGYDDAQTIALKRSWADAKCLGGTSQWSIDLYSGAGSGDDPVTLSTTARCGTANGEKTCMGSAWGNCCSASGWCGTTNAHCNVKNGCQLGFGTCNSQDAVASTDGSCGYVGGVFKTCSGTSFGSCCSQYGWCGSTSGHCFVSNNCQANFGICTA